VLQLRQRSTRLACAIARLTVMFARARFGTRAGDFARVWARVRAIARFSGHGMFMQSTLSVYTV